MAVQRVDVASERRHLCPPLSWRAGELRLVPAERSRVIYALSSRSLPLTGALASWPWLGLGLAPHTVAARFRTIRAFLLPGRAGKARERAPYTVLSPPCCARCLYLVFSPSTLWRRRPTAGHTGVVSENMQGLGAKLRKLPGQAKICTPPGGEVVAKIWLELRRLPPIKGFVGSGPGLVTLLA